jgi:general stress protein 26
MKHKTIEEISKRMAGIDIAILSTHTQNGQIANRPMSNNGDVAYDGTSYYFTFEQARTVSDIQANPKVALGFTGPGRIFSDAIYVAVEGIAETHPRQSHFPSPLDKRSRSLVRKRCRHAEHRPGQSEGRTYHVLGR